MREKERVHTENKDVGESTLGLDVDETQEVLNEAGRVLHGLESACEESGVKVRGRLQRLFREASQVLGLIGKGVETVAKFCKLIKEIIELLE